VKAQAPGAGAANLDRDADQRSLAPLTPAAQAFLVAAEEELVDFASSLSASRWGATIARRSFCKISHAVS